MRKRFLLAIMLATLFVIVIGCSSSDVNQDTSNNTNDDESSKETQNSEDILANYPEEPITVLVGYAPGGGSDIQARTIIKTLNDNNIVDQTFKVENLPGASGVHAFNRLYEESDNNYQVMEVPEYGAALLDGSMQGVDYSDFQYIGQTATQTMAIIAKPDSKIQSLDDLISNLEDDPSSLSIAVSGAIDGTEASRWYSIYKEIKGGNPDVYDLSFVPQDGASAPSIIGGHTDVALENPAVALDHVKTGDLKVIAVLSKERLDGFPDAPTLVEEGINIVHSRARGWWIGKDVPKEIVEYWEDKLKQLTETEDWKKYTEENMFERTFLNSEEYENFLVNTGEEYKEYLKLVK